MAASTWRLAGLAVPPRVYMHLVTAETATGETTHSNLQLYCFQAKFVAGYVDMWMVTLRFYVAQLLPRRRVSWESIHLNTGMGGMHCQAEEEGVAAWLLNADHGQQQTRIWKDRYHAIRIRGGPSRWVRLLGIRYRCLFCITAKHMHQHPSRYAFPAPIHSHLLLYGALPSVSQTLHSRISL